MCSLQLDSPVQNIYIDRHPRDSRVESSSPGKNLETSRGNLFLYFGLQRKRQFFYYNPKIFKA
jgi:hypothetical protein